jgi:hypothetical protein
MLILFWPQQSSRKPMSTRNCVQSGVSLMRYLLDTNTIITLLKDPGGRGSKRVRQHRPAEVGVSAIVMHALHFGYFKSQRVENNLAPRR